MFFFFFFFERIDNRSSRTGAYALNARRRITTRTITRRVRGAPLPGVRPQANGVRSHAVYRRDLTRPVGMDHTSGRYGSLRFYRRRRFSFADTAVATITKQTRRSGKTGETRGPGRETRRTTWPLPIVLPRISAGDDGGRARRVRRSASEASGARSRTVTFWRQNAPPPRLSARPTRRTPTAWPTRRRDGKKRVPSSRAPRVVVDSCVCVCFLSFVILSPPRERTRDAYVVRDVSPARYGETIEKLFSTNINSGTYCR